MSKFSCGSDTYLILMADICIEKRTMHELSQLSRGEICVANLKAPPANGASLDRLYYTIAAKLLW